MSIKKFITPTIIATSMIIMITGVMMFFHLKPSGVSSLHEWVGMFFVICTILHLCLHKKPFMNYFTKKYALINMLLILVASGILFTQMQKEKENPMGKVISTLSNVPLEKLAPAINQSPQEVILKLNALGITNVTNQDSLNSIAQHNHKKPTELLFSIFKGV